MIHIKCATELTWRYIFVDTTTIICNFDNFYYHLQWMWNRKFNCNKLDTYSLYLMQLNWFTIIECSNGFLWLIFNGTGTVIVCLLSVCSMFMWFSTQWMAPFKIQEMFNCDKRRAFNGSHGWNRQGNEMDWRKCLIFLWFVCNGRKVNGPCLNGIAKSFATTSWLKLLNG